MVGTESQQLVKPPKETSQTVTYHIYTIELRSSGIVRFDVLRASRLEFAATRHFPRTAQFAYLQVPRIFLPYDSQRYSPYLLFNLRRFNK